jgi:hypothetical protein
LECDFLAHADSPVRFRGSRLSGVLSSGKTHQRVRRGRLRAGMTERLIRTIDELVAAIRARRDELDLSHETLDHIAGLQPGYVSKLLAPEPMKGLGPISLPALLGALGVALVLVEDTAQVERVRGQWTKRKRPQRKAAPD